MTRSAPSLAAERDANADDRRPPERNPSPAANDGSGAAPSRDGSGRMTLGRAGDPTVRLCLIILTFLALCVAADQAKTVLVPVVFAMLLAAILAPLAGRLRALGLPSLVAALTSVFMPLAIIVAAVQAVLPGAEVWQRRLPLFIDNLELKLDGLRASLGEARELARQVQGIAGGADGGGVEVAPDERLDFSFLWDIPLFIGSASLTLILTVFILTLAPIQVRRLMHGAPFGPRVSRLMAIGSRHLVHDMARYFLTVTTINTGLGIATYLTMSALGMPQPYLWGIVGGLVNFVPYAGPVVGTTVIAIASLISFDTVPAILLPPLAYVALTSLEGYFITPTLVGRTLTMNPLLVLLSVVFWAWLWGVAGAVLAVPLLIVMLRAPAYVQSATGNGRLPQRYSGAHAGRPALGQRLGRVAREAFGRAGGTKAAD